MKKISLRPLTTTTHRKGLAVINRSAKMKHTLFTTPFRTNKQPIHFRIDSTDDIQYRLIDTSGKTQYTARSNRDYFTTSSQKTYFLDVITPPHAQTHIRDITLEISDKKDQAIHNHLVGDTLCIIPEYPECQENSALLKELASYRSAGFDLDVVAVNELFSESAQLFYSAGVNRIANMGFNELRLLLQIKKYSRIIIYGFNEKIAQVLDGSDTTASKIYIIVEGEDVLFHNFQAYGTAYFKQPQQSAPDYVEKVFAEKRRVVANYAKSKNILWVFPSTTMRKTAEHLLDLSFLHHKIATPEIDTEIFTQKKISKSSIKNICLISNCSNNSKYGVDCAVRALLELSTTSGFKNTTISFYGHGGYYHTLTAPLRGLTNVSLHEGQLTDTDRGIAYAENDLVILPRKDFSRQNITSIREALSAGTTVLAPDSAIGDAFPQNTPNLIPFPADNFYKLSELLNTSSGKFSKKQSSPNRTANPSTVDVIKSDKQTSFENFTGVEPAPSPLLSIVVPSYNCEKFLRNSVLSLVNHPLAHKLEVIIVNDGSKDSTADVARQIIEKTTTAKGSIVTLIDKENGGHGSTINAGIKAARGKYFRLMDGDDYFYIDNFVAFLKKLEDENSDIILTDYVEDFAITATKNIPVLYEFMQPGIQYDLNFMNYEGYGFWRWGPLLPTNTYKTKLLKDSKFAMDEHCFYVDMEYNLITYILAKTVTYYPLPIYNYYLGRPGQSMSKESMKRNVLHHEKVTLRLIAELYARAKDITPNKRSYLINRLIIPMCKTQYFITTEYFKDGKYFQSFDRKLQQYPEFYNNPEIAGRTIRSHRLTKGLSVRVDKTLKRTGALVRKQIK